MTQEIPWKYPDRKTATKILVITSKKTGQLRRVIDCDSDHEYKFHEVTKHPGEHHFYMTHAEYDAFENKLDEFKDHVAKKTGHKKAPDLTLSRHAHVDEKGNIVNIISADLSCGDYINEKGHKLIHHPEVNFNWKHINGNLVPPNKISVK